MSELKGDDWELVEGPGFNKAVDVTDRSVTEGTQSWSSILADMEMARRSIPTISPPHGHPAQETVIPQCKPMF